MSSRSRRKTLSHTEIENFLFDLSPTSAANISSSNTSVTSTSTSSIVSNSSLNIQTSKNNQVPDFLSLDFPPQNQIQPTKAKMNDLKESIRSIYHHIHHNNHMSNLPSDIKNQAKAIYDEIQYPILPLRILTPEAFKFPPNSVAAKKELLHSMTPMLTEGENQRKIDTTQCEEFTRCRVEKNKIRASCYDYIDIDTNLRISGEEYTKRYMLFVQHSKNITPNNSSYQSANDKIDPFADNSDLSSMVMLTESIKGHDERVTNTKKTPLKDVTSETCHRNQSNQPLPFSIPSQETDLFWKDDLLGCQNDDSENFFCLKGKKREKQSESGRSRRRTLSPTTSRNMLLEVLESEEIEVSSSKSDVSTDLSKELVPSGFVPLELPILPQVEESFPQISPTTVNKKAEIPVTKRIKEFALSSTKDDQYNQEALKRFKIRQEIARWKYTWEIVSNEAAMTALQYILKISEE